MADGHGGHRTPHNPAPASGPGKLSRRTDGGPGQKLQAQTDQPYGDRRATLNQERAAPMAQQDSIQPAAVPAGHPPYAGGDFGGPTNRPGEPVTHGVDIGPGGGPEVLGLPTAGAMPTGYLTNMLQQMSATDTTGTLGKLYVIAKQRNV